PPTASRRRRTTPRQTRSFSPGVDRPSQRAIRCLSLASFGRSGDDACACSTGADHRCCHHPVARALRDRLGSPPHIAQHLRRPKQLSDAPTIEHDPTPSHLYPSARRTLTTTPAAQPVSGETHTCGSPSTSHVRPRTSNRSLGSTSTPGGP